LIPKAFIQTVYCAVFARFTVLFWLANICFFGIFFRIFLLIKKKKSLSGRQFLKEKNGNLVCEECYAKTAPKCTQCKQGFAPGESYKKITDSLFYHNHCFVCCGPCHKPIGAEFYDMENDKYLCIECYDKYGLNYDKASSDDQLRVVYF
jgi:ribosomal protein L40E